MAFMDAEDELFVLGHQKARTAIATVDTAEVVRYGVNTGANLLVEIAHIEIYAISGREVV
jgi:hypothetical protein